MKKTMILAVVCVALLAGQGMATTTSLIMADWSCASPLGGWSSISGSNVGYSGYLYTVAGTVSNYMKFDLSSLAPAAGFNLVVNSAKVTIWNTTTQTGTPFTDDFYTVASDSWTQTSVNNTNKPALGTLLGSLSPWVSGGSMQISPASLATYVQQEASGDGTASFGFKAGAGCVMVDAFTPRHAFYMIKVAHPLATTLDVNYSYVAVPEPVTMSILGLGSLALLRKRK